jgi:hypothetical protein
MDKRAVVLQRQGRVVGVLRVQLGQLQARRQAFGVEEHGLLQGGDAGPEIAIRHGVPHLLPQRGPAALGRRIRGRGQAGQQSL